MHKVHFWRGLGSGVTSLETTASAALTPPSDLIPAETNWDGCQPFPFFFFFFPNMTYTNKENKDVCG